MGNSVKMLFLNLYVILTATECLTMSDRPKEPKYARNKNVLVVGGSAILLIPARVSITLFNASPSVEL